MKKVVRHLYPQRRIIFHRHKDPHFKPQLDNVSDSSLVTASAMAQRELVRSDQSGLKFRGRTEKCFHEAAPRMVIDITRWTHLLNDSVLIEAQAGSVVGLAPRLAIAIDVVTRDGPPQSALAALDQS